MLTTFMINPPFLALIISLHKKHVNGAVFFAESSIDFSNANRYNGHKIKRKEPDTMTGFTTTMMMSMRMCCMCMFSRAQNSARLVSE